MSALSRFLPYLSLLMTSVAVAEEQQIDAGLVFTSDEAPHYGEYSGLQDDGAHFVGALDLSGALDWLGIDRGGWRHPAGR